MAPLVLALCSLVVALPLEALAGAQVELADAGVTVPGSDAGVREASPDTDVDGLPDQLEQRTGTERLDPDTDHDGVADGVEDADRDGVVDPGETDPRRPGIFPGSGPYIPEPMNFDLVRGLGARRGELEANVLVQVRPNTPNFGLTTWAPELEWAPIDNFAIELELPFADRELEALKLALQWTAPSPWKQFTHGVQAIAEYRLDEHAAELTALYLFGARYRRLSGLGMLGGRFTVGSRQEAELLVNPSVYVDLDEAVTVGLEANLGWAPGHDVEGLLLGQLHWQISQRLRVQVGGGFEWRFGRLGALVVTRWVLE